MSSIFRRIRYAGGMSVALVFLGIGNGCGNPAAPAVAGAVGATLLGGQAPAQEVEQVYYLGVFDPQEQLPPAVYRVTVRGQASVFNETRFASGWVPATAIDTLNENVRFSGEGSDSLQLQSGSQTPNVAQSSGQGGPVFNGRRLVLFGPEGFREAPKGHRLVIVMGSDPGKFFGAVGDTFDVLANAQAEKAGLDATKSILREHLRIKDEQTALDRLDEELRKAGGAS